MTKSAQIMSLSDGTLSDKAIAKIVGCHEAYVRVVRQRRAGRDANQTYIAKVAPLGDRDAARAAGRKALRSGRNYGSAYRNTMVRTGAAALRRQEATC